MALLKKIALRLFLAGLMAAGLITATANADPQPSGDLLVLCYHSIKPEALLDDNYTITQKQFVEQLEYLKAHGYQFVSAEAVRAAMTQKQKLPQKAVLLSFDDAYRSYYDFVVPILKQYGYPSMLAVVGSWIENDPPKGLAEPLMSWKQIKEVAQNPLVTIASHTFDLHKATQYTPQGNVGAIVGVRAFHQNRNLYETETAYRDKLQKDFDRQRDLFLKQVGRVPNIMVWPYGHYNALSNKVANQNGYSLRFGLDEKNLGLADLSRSEILNRVIVVDQEIDVFAYKLKQLWKDPTPMRAMQVDLDLIYAPGDAEQTDRNLGELIERLVAMQVNTVFLQAFADPDGDGNVSRVYFHNRVLPVEADIFAHAVHQIKIRGIKVYAWLPVMSYIFPDKTFNRKYQVQEFKNGQTSPSSSWYRRLTPFSDQAAQKVGLLFEDLAAGAQISGVLFQDDAYLTDFEDFHPMAIDAFKEKNGGHVTPEQLLSGGALSEQWMRFKTDRLIAYIEGLSTAVRKFRPDACFARNIYALPVSKPHSEQWFAQNYDRFLDHYDYVVIMAYPQMENALHSVNWLKDLVRAAERPRMPAKTVFKLQAYDWKLKQWVPDALLLEEMRTVLAAGIRHLAYYPDNLWQSKPDLNIIKKEMSTRQTWVRK
jgi:poly-beta-1,6-N-acetyl-D-glucosamine N-deacetylase